MGATAALIEPALGRKSYVRKLRTKVMSWGLSGSFGNRDRLLANSVAKIRNYVSNATEYFGFVKLQQPTTSDSSYPVR